MEFDFASKKGLLIIEGVLFRTFILGWFFWESIPILSRNYFHPLGRIITLGLFFCSLYLSFNFFAKKVTKKIYLNWGYACNIFLIALILGAVSHFFTYSFFPSSIWDALSASLNSTGLGLFLIFFSFIHLLHHIEIINKNIYV